ncbi:MAG: MFS transporter [Patescibacteria group bacterium]
MYSEQKITRKRLTAIFAGMFGNILEWYDFALYGFLAVILSELFFPSGNATVALLGTYGVFAAGFLTRPLGAWIFGYIGDTISRRRSLLLSVVLMGTATFLLGTLPTYAVVGIWAPILLILLRLLQGLSVGGEFSASVTYLVEQAPRASRGLFGSFANVGSMGGMLLGVGAATIVITFIPHDALILWGWRIPFLFGGILGLIALLLRRQLPDSVIHTEKKRHLAQTPLHEALSNNRYELIQALLFSLGYAVFFYIVLVYLPTYANEFLNIPIDYALQFNTAVIALVIILIPIFGYLSDTVFRRKKMIMGVMSLAAIAAVPLFSLLGAPGLFWFVVVQLTLGVFIAAVLGSAPALYVELFPKSDRLTAYSITFNVSLGVFGGTAPFIATWLIHVTGDILMPAYYAVATLLIALVALWTMIDRSREPLS